MSYCRFAWDGSDVYVFDSVNGGIDCCGCSLGGFMTGPPEEDGAGVAMVAHLMEHRKAGHTVPQYAIDRLMSEAIELHGFRSSYIPWKIGSALRAWRLYFGRKMCRRYGHVDASHFLDHTHNPLCETQCSAEVHRKCARCHVTGLRVEGTTTWYG